MPPDDLPGRHRHHVRLPGAHQALMRLADQQVLQRHRQRLGSTGLCPGAASTGSEQPGGLAAVDPGPDGVRRGGFEQRRWTAGAAVSGVLLRDQPGRAHPDPDGTERERRGDLAAAADPARGRAPAPGADRVDDLRDRAPCWRSRRCARPPRSPGRPRCPRRSPPACARAPPSRPAPRPACRVRGRCAMTSGGGGPSAFAISRAGWASATSTCLRAIECSQPSTPSAACAPSGSGGTPSLSSVCSTKSLCAAGISWSRSLAAPSAGTGPA